MLRCIPVVATLLPIAACEFQPQYRVYGTDLESREQARAFLWPADRAAKTFRYVVEGHGAPRKISELAFTPGRPVTLAIDGSLDGVTLVLPPEPSTLLRSVGNQLLEALADRHAGLSTHLVVSTVEWADIDSIDGFEERAREARDGVRDSSGGSGSLFADLLLALMPDVIVVPQAGSDAFLTARPEQGETLMTPDPVAMEYAVASLAELLDAVRQPADPKARPSNWLVVIEPTDADPDMRRRCAQLVDTAYGASDPSWVIVRRRSAVIEADRLTSIDALRDALPELASEPFETPNSK